MSKDRSVENERKRKQKSLASSLILLHFQLHSYFCFRHFHLSSILPFDKIRIYPLERLKSHCTRATPEAAQSKISDLIENDLIL